MILIILGGLLLIGLIADVIGRHTPLPRVTVLLLSGILIGASGFDLVPQAFVEDWFPHLTHFALAMVGFLLGQQLTLANLRKRGGTVVLLALGKVVGAALCVAGALIMVGVEPPLALILAGIAPATAPAATFDVVKEVDAKSEFSRLLLSVVAVDDALGLVVFSLLLAAASSLAGIQDNGGIVVGLYEIGGSLLFGGLIGLPMAFLTGRIREGAPMQAEAFGFVLICAGGSVLLELSPILAAMAMGAFVDSVAVHHKRPFHAIEQIEWPFMILFFILAGASLRMDGEFEFALIVLVYVVARGIGGSAGLYAAGTGSNVDSTVRLWLGPALLPQAGVALGMALIAAQRFEIYSEVILSLILMSTVLLEVLSPIITRSVLKRMESLEER
jgi:Kef-type K+ transport system membrane component KefB